jgi:hypothetical protein
MVLVLGLIRRAHFLSSAPTSAVQLTTSLVVLVLFSSKVQEGHWSPFIPVVVGCGGLLTTGKLSAPLVLYLAKVQQDNAGLAIWGQYRNGLGSIVMSIQSVQEPCGRAGPDHP